MPFLYIGGAVIMILGHFEGTSSSIKTMSDYIVTSSSSTDGSYFFYDPSSDLKTQQDFNECLLNRAQSIGLVLDKKYGEQSHEDLRSIFTLINNDLKAT